MSAGVGMLNKVKDWVRRIKADVLTLYVAGRDTRTPAYAKLLALAVAAYALSPIDLIPDFIPILGYLDDILLVPLGIMVTIRLIPGPLLAEFRATAKELATLPSSRTAGIIIVFLWLAGLAWGGWWVMQIIYPPSA